MTAPVAFALALSRSGLQRIFPRRPRFLHLAEGARDAMPADENGSPTTPRRTRRTRRTRCTPLHTADSRRTPR
ncbi:hypothetical protein GCM10009078_04670 [Cupriavidus gilardii]